MPALMNLASESAVQTITRLQSATGSIPLVPAVRITVLKTMIPLAFPEEDITVAHSVARLITDKINLLWTISKEDSDDMIKDEKQILHLVIKASSATLTTRGAIPVETFRLYPPTKSIYRAGPKQSTSLDNTAEHDTTKVNIKELHRDPKTWGENAPEFDPSRWCNLSPGQAREQNKALLAFSTTPHQCPAARNGPILIEVMVGALANVLGREYELSGLGTEGLPKRPLKARRHNFEDVMVVPTALDPEE
ncbi:MAG: hypothetical protein MMC23_000429 [Stictis urceolatum]|nr:hypothetical protein [Stictis urceolata]